MKVISLAGFMMISVMGVLPDSLPTLQGPEFSGFIPESSLMITGPNRVEEESDCF